MGSVASFETPSCPDSRFWIVSNKAVGRAALLFVPSLSLIWLRIVPYNSGRRTERNGAVRSGQNQNNKMTLAQSLKVRFSLTQWQDFMRQSSDPQIGRRGPLEGHSSVASDGVESSTLQGGGIRTNIYVVSSKTFKVTGPVR